MVPYDPNKPVGCASCGMASYTKHYVWYMPCNHLFCWDCHCKRMKCPICDQVIVSKKACRLHMALVGYDSWPILRPGSISYTDSTSDSDTAIPSTSNTPINTMQITLKTLKQQTFILEVDMGKDTVLSLKEKLCVASEQAYPVERQCLIYLGKIMEDEKLLSQYKLDHQKFIVVMNKKSNTGEAAGDGASGTTPATASAKDSKTEKEVKPKDSSASSSAGATATASQSKPSTSSSTASAATEQQKAKGETKTADNTAGQADETATPADMQANIRRITEMGYSEQSARMALEICANYPDRAVEYLLSEMASGNETEVSLGAGIAGGVGQGTAAAGLAAGTGSGGSNPLAFLTSHPVFQDMKRLLQEDPNLLPHLMQRIQTSNPDLMRIIANNQEEFLALINEPQHENQMSQELEDIAAAMVNSLTPSDMDAIDRLKALGYPEHLVIQAYIACERDEYNAAEFLVSQTLDEEE